MDEVKKTPKLIKKLEGQKYQWLIHFFKKQSCIQNISVIEKWVKRRRFFIDDKNMQKFDLTGQVSSL